MGCWCSWVDDVVLSWDERRRGLTRRQSRRTRAGALADGRREVLARASHGGKVSRGIKMKGDAEGEEEDGCDLRVGGG